MSDPLRRSLKQIPWVLVSRLVQLASSFALSFWIPRHLPIANYGAFRLVFSIASVSVYFTSLGLEATLSRYIPEFLSKKRPDQVRQILKGAALLRISLILVLLAGAWGAREFIYRYFNLPELLQERIVFIALYICATQIHTLIGSTLHNAYLHQQLVSLVEIISSGVRFFWVAAVLHFHWGFSSLLLAFVGVEWLTLLTYLCFLPQAEGPSSSLSQSDWKRIVRFALFVLVAPLGNMLLDFSIDNLIIAHFMNMEAVGLYAFAAMFIQILGNLNPGMFLKNVVSYFFIQKHTESKNEAEFAKTLNKGNQSLIKLSLYILLPVSLSTMVLGRPVVQVIFQGKFLGALPSLYWLLLCFLCQHTFIYGFSHIFNTVEKLDLRLYGYFFAGVFNFIVEIILVPKLGILGAAIATGTSSLLLCTYYYWVISRKIGIPLSLPGRALIKVFGLSLAVMTLEWVCVPWITNPFRLVSVVIGAMLTYLLLSLKFHPFDSREVELFQVAMGKRS